MLNYRSPIPAVTPPPAPPSLEEQLRRLQAENSLLRQEVRVAQDAANLTAHLVIEQFEQTDAALQRVQAANAYLGALHETALGLMSQLDLHELLKAIIVRAGALLKTEHGYIYLLEADGQEMKNRINTGVFENYVGHRIRPGQGAAGRAWQTGQPFVVEDYSRWEDRLHIYDPAGLKALMVVPLAAVLPGGETHTLGTLGLAYLSDQRFGQAEVEILSRFAGLASIALLNARLYMDAQLEVIERRRAEDAAEAANRAKSYFLATMSHELRTPLNAILGFSEFIGRADNLTPSQRDNLAIINQSGEHLLQLINDILEISKIEAGRISLEEEDFDLYNLLSSLENILRLRAQQQNVSLVFDIAPDVPQFIRTDPGKLRQVLMNLLSNAIKFTTDGQVSLMLRVDPAEARRLLFAVEDTGMGIAPEEISLLFNPFAQTRSGKNIRQGTGLGLAISKAFVQLMGGEIRVKSQPGQGSCFEFDIHVSPLEKLTSVPLPHGKPPRALGLKAGQTAPGGGPFRLLVVDDVETNRVLMENLLRTLGYPLGAEPSACGFEIRAVSNGQEALQAWEHWHPHLIWMDIRMPVMDGIEATHRIKSQSAGKDVIVIALTAAAFEEDRAQALAAGIDGFVRKPFREKFIVSALADHLGLQFVYENETEVPPTEETVSRPAQSGEVDEALPVLPPDWLQEVRQALLEGEIRTLRSLAEQIHSTSPAFSERLAQMIENFELDEIANLLQFLEKKAE